MTKNKLLGIYLHIPFCYKKCGYCDFVSYTDKYNKAEDYFRALEKEITEYSKVCAEYDVDSIFIGGGTPSSVETNYITKTVALIRDKFNVAEKAEITIEMNPESVDSHKIASYLQSGINRFSVGVQSFKESHLKSLGRIHNSEKAKSALKIIRENGVENYSIDMIMAIPNQNFEDVKSDLDTALSLKPAHISYYSLIIEENTPFESLYSSDTESFPDEDTDRQMYHYIVKTLKNNGYDQYEISNFSRVGFESKHNLKYWSLDEYLGFGVSASSYFKDERSKNINDIKEYIDIVEKGLQPKEYSYKVTEKDNIEDYIIFGLRKNSGIDKYDFKNRFGISFNELYCKESEKLVSESLAHDDEKCFCLTDRGRDIANYCELQFIK